LKILSEYVPNEKGKGFSSIAKKYKINASNIKRWHKNKQKLIDQLNNPEVSVRVQRKLPGVGRKVKFLELDEKLFKWVLDRNERGFIVKDSYITAKAKHLAEEYNIPSEDFKISSGWLKAFKKRHKLVSRRHTTTKSLPTDVKSNIDSFFKEVQQIINEKKIKPGNILNLDQVPRYYERELTSTIAVKGVKKVLLKKASSSHKRLTVSFTISADGKILAPHVLFSKLKNVPKINNCIRGAVNESGIWSEKIFHEYMQEVLLKRTETMFNKEPVLLILDSFGVHVKVAASKKYEKFNIFMILIPP
jgi:Tc5 transposase DNA-binding domain/DDE superfamily endonuclease